MRKYSLKDSSLVLTLPPPKEKYSKLLRSYDRILKAYFSAKTNAAVTCDKTLRYLYLNSIFIIY